MVTIRYLLTQPTYEMCSIIFLVDLQERRIMRWHVDVGFINVGAVTYWNSWCQLLLSKGQQLQLKTDYKKHYSKLNLTLIVHR